MKVHGTLFQRRCLWRGTHRETSHTSLAGGPSQMPYTSIRFGCCSLGREGTPPPPIEPAGEGAKRSSSIEARGDGETKQTTQPLTLPPPLHHTAAPVTPGGVSLCVVAQEMVYKLNSAMLQKRCTRSARPQLREVNLVHEELSAQLVRQVVVLCVVLLDDDRAAPG